MEGQHTNVFYDHVYGHIPTLPFGFYVHLLLAPCFLLLLLLHLLPFRHRLLPFVDDKDDVEFYFKKPHALPLLSY